MSFILDALKKSEAERQRQAGPTLLEVRVMQPRRRQPMWAIALAALLAVNLLALLWFLLRKPATDTESAAARTPVATASAAPPAAIATPAPTVSGPAPAAGAAPAAPEATSATAAGAAAVPAPSPDGDRATGPPSLQNSADFAPAVAVSGGGVRIERDTRTLPSFDEVGGNLPPLRLDLHVYAARPSERYALINMHKAREGDVLPEGARVIEITNDGVVLEFRGQQFILQPQR
ncbi:MAG: general secretion pathway protein GspB [Steroidobacterales bacterium]